MSWQEIEAPRPRVGFDVERLAPTVKLNAVRGEEIDPPAGVKPIVWLLLTTHPVENLEDALCGSWAGIGRGSDDRAGVPGHEEPRFRSGGDLEDSRIETPEAMAKLGPSSRSSC